MRVSWRGAVGRGGHVIAQLGGWGFGWGRGMQMAGWGLGPGSRAHVEGVRRSTLRPDEARRAEERTGGPRPAACRSTSLDGVGKRARLERYNTQSGALWHVLTRSKRAAARICGPDLPHAPRCRR